ncbi:hypothetical protein DSL72_009520 [Monilinia vaccinii-corymbosi]|uniref:Uncharacterized protein n=1 Tax=Monilinia vaccinii-corymbosi TaxID=61207 RepID=A0A8A3PPI7_9HELO|nr:hypothetical protein DSL72_009520 [Monilinia vaccinii-corymbosi]
MSLRVGQRGWDPDLPYTHLQEGLPAASRDYVRVHPLVATVSVQDGWVLQSRIANVAGLGSDSLRVLANVCFAVQQAPVRHKRSNPDKVMEIEKRPGL